MRRRITAALMALVLVMIPTLSVRADTPGLVKENGAWVDKTYVKLNEDGEHIIGSEIRLQGVKATPSKVVYPPENGSEWRRVMKGNQYDVVKLDTCPDPEHHHVGLCYGVAPLICTDTDEAHTHDENCYGEPPLICEEKEHSYTDLDCKLNHRNMYRWQVTEIGGSAPTVPPTTDPAADQPSTDPSTEPPEEPEVENPNAMYVRCMGEDNTLLEGAEFFLTVYQPDADSEDFVASGKTVKTEEKGTVATLDFSEYIRENAVTEDVVWRLGQNAFPDDPNNYDEIGDKYMELTKDYFVTVGPDANGNIVVKNVTMTPPETTEGDEEKPEVDSVGNYEAETRTLTVACDLWKAAIYVDVILVGFEGNAPYRIGSTVTLVDPNNQDAPHKGQIVNHLSGVYIGPDYIKEYYLAYAKDELLKNGFNLVQVPFEGCKMGQYKIQGYAADVDGYEKKDPVVKVSNGDTLEITDTVTLTKNKSAAWVTVIVEYVPTASKPTTEPTTEPTEEPTTAPTEEPTTAPTEEPTTKPTEAPATKPTEAPATNPTTGGSTDNEQSTTIIVKTVNDLGEELNNCEIGLYKDNTLIKKWKPTDGNLFVLDNLQDLVGEGETASYILKETKAAAGHRLSGDSFKVTITGGTRVDVKRNTSGLSDLLQGSGVEMSTDGKQIVTFVNERKTTQIEISCEVTADFLDGAWQDETLIEELQKKQYAFVLTWENAKGEQVEETVTVTGGTSVLFEAELPFGTNYKVAAAEADAPYNTTISENFEGTVEATELVGNILIEAVQTYTVKPGEPLQLSLVKVDADTKLPLAGVKFLLKNENGEELQTYVSGEQGEMELVDVFKAPGTYALEETETLEGYELLQTGVGIEVTAQYSEENENGTPALIQTMNAELISDMVVEESDGSFWVENALSEDADGGKKSGKLGIGAVIGFGVAGLAGAAGVTTVLIRRKRKKGQQF